MSGLCSLETVNVDWFSQDFILIIWGMNFMYMVLWKIIDNYFDSLCEETTL